jgi:hypothetical protein
MAENRISRLGNAIPSIGGIGAIFLVGAVGIYVEGKWTPSSLWLMTGWLTVCAWIAGMLLYVSGQQVEKDKVRATVVMVASVAVAVGLVGVSFWQHSNAQSWAIAVLWSLACLAIGGLGGLLFGIPRSRAKASTTDQSPIEQIADWLTKIIVGLGLTNLSKIPGKLSGWAAYMAEGIGKDHASESAALSMALYFTVLGFVGGYLLTNLFLDDMINKFNVSEH